MNCPLHRNGDGSLPPCQEKKCAWWSYNVNGCIVHDLAILTNHLGNVKDAIEELVRVTAAG